MQIKTSKHSKPKRTRLRKTRRTLKDLRADSSNRPKPPTPIQRFLAVPAIDFKFLSDHLKNYFTVGGLCILAGYLIKKGANYDKMVPWLGFTLGAAILAGALLYGVMNSIQMGGALMKARKGRLWVIAYSSAVVLMSFVLGAVIAQGLERV